MASVVVAFASETGTAEALSWRCCAFLHLRGVAVDGPHPLDALTLDAVEAPLVIFAATCGDGARPANARDAWASLLKRNAPKLPRLAYALYGLGDARYGLKYNAFARKLDARLLQLGASALAPRALGDAASADGVRGPLAGFLRSLGPPLGVPAAAMAALGDRCGDEAPADLAAFTPRYAASAAAADADADAYDDAAALAAYVDECLRLGCGDASAPYAATVASTARLTADEWWQEVRHVSFACDAPYRAGDVAVVTPANGRANVDRALAILRRRDPALTLGAAIAVAAAPSDGSYAAPAPRYPRRATLGALLAQCVDLHAPPTGRALGILALFADASEDGAEQRGRLKRFAEGRDAPLLREYVVSERRSVLDVLEDFHRVAPSLSGFLEACDWIRPRQYSIASEGGSAALALCVARATYETPYESKRVGLASAWLCDLGVGAGARIAVKRGAFAAPPASAPLLFVGPGTGVAPGRAMIRARPGADNRLLQGYRDAAKDALYAGEWPDLPGLAVDVAVSRHADEAKRRRVTGALRDRAAEVAGLLTSGAGYVYVAGNAQMATDVAAVLLAVLQSDGGLDARAAAALLRKREKEGKFAVEGFG